MSTVSRTTANKLLAAITIPSSKTEQTIVQASSSSLKTKCIDLTLSGEIENEEEAIKVAKEELIARKKKVEEAKEALKEQREQERKIKEFLKNNIDVTVLQRMTNK